MIGAGFMTLKAIGALGELAEAIGARQTERVRYADPARVADVVRRAAAVVGVLLAIVAYVMANKGTNDLKLSSLAPSRTAKNVKRDAQAVKEAYDDK